MGNRIHTEINSLSDWTKYVHQNMKNGIWVEGVGQTIIQTKDGETIAVWQNFGLGHVLEGRSPKRLRENTTTL